LTKYYKAGYIEEDRKGGKYNTHTWEDEKMSQIYTEILFGKPEKEKPVL